MVDPLETGGLVLAGGGVVKALDMLWDKYVRKEHERERDRRELERDGKLDRVLSEIGELKVEARNDRQRLADVSTSVNAAFSEVKERINGISGNHGPRLGQLEQDFSALRARIDGLERKRR